MKKFASIFIMLIFACASTIIGSTATENWPQQLTSGNNKIIIYQPQPDSLIGTRLFGRSAFSVTPQGKEPIFGALWFDARINVDKDARTYTIESAKVVDVRFPGQTADHATKIEQFKKLLESEIPKWEMVGSYDGLLSTLQINENAIKKSEDLNNAPPEIIYTDKVSILLLFDGDPKFEKIQGSTLLNAVNTPYLVIQDPKNGTHYFWGDPYWFSSTDPVKGGWKYVSNPPQEIKGLQQEYEKQNNQQNSNTTKDEKSKSAIPQIIVRTKPSELIQSNGEPQYSPIQGTGLLYVKNSDDNIFKLIENQKTYILLSGRWYASTGLNGPWTFVPSEKLPADFSKIPEGSDRDIVLASIAGTDAAKEAVLDAQIPQTAAVNRSEAKCNVKYDGDPKFEVIKGTSLLRAVNTSSTVILSNKEYYVCENAIWFVGNGPLGPWLVATQIPAEIQKIPPDDPTYNVKYVYIYDVTPQVVYVGYTPGYMGCYVYGPTIVYGTGYPYPGWYGPYYYPRPVTYGFSMHYNPWTGWSMGFGVSNGCFSMSFRVGGYGGWWGPPMYRPPYHPPYNHYYGRGNTYVRNTTINVNNNYNNRYNQNNIYKNRGNSVNPNPKRDVGARPSTGDVKPGSTRPTGGNQVSTRDNKANKANTPNNVYTDKNGNVYRKNGNNWEQNTGGKNWQNVDTKQADNGNRQNNTREAPTTKPSQGSNNTNRQQPSNFDRQQMDKQNVNRDRGTQRQSNSNNFNKSSGGGSGGATRGGGSGGGSRGGRR